jgi:hypothetical protein
MAASGQMADIRGRQTPTTGLGRRIGRVPTMSRRWVPWNHRHSAAIPSPRRSWYILRPMGTSQEWRFFLACPDVAPATPVAEYLTLHDCPAYVLPVSPSFNLMPTAAVRVPAGFLRRAHHIWSNADVLGDLTAGELEYIVTGTLAGEVAGPREHDDAA